MTAFTDELATVAAKCGVAIEKVARLSGLADDVLVDGTRRPSTHDIERVTEALYTAMRKRQAGRHFDGETTRNRLILAASR